MFYVWRKPSYRHGCTPPECDFCKTPFIYHSSYGVSSRKIGHYQPTDCRPIPRMPPTTHLHGCEAYGRRIMAVTGKRLKAYRVLCIWSGPTTTVQNARVDFARATAI